MHDAVRQKELEAGLTGVMAQALQRFQDNDDVLWAALFCAAVLVRESSRVYHQVGGPSLHSSEGSDTPPVFDAPLLSVLAMLPIAISNAHFDCLLYVHTSIYLAMPA